MDSQDEVAGPKQSWVTLAINDIYAIGAVVLGYSLREAKTAHKLTVLVNEDVGAVTRHLLCQVFDVILPLTQLSGADTLGGPERVGDEAACSSTKLHVWRLPHLNKGVFLDADTLVLSNCDDLFDRQELAAAPLRGWPDLFDTGVFVFEPSEKTHAQVIEAARNNAGFHGLDRDVLNEVFGSKWKNDLSLQLPFLYNLQARALRDGLSTTRLTASTVRRRPRSSTSGDSTSHGRSPTTARGGKFTLRPDALTTRSISRSGGKCFRGMFCPSWLATRAEMARS
ncbi:glycogenin-2-like [Haemaphysalis longicornis]